MVMNEIDWDALNTIRVAHHAWRHTPKGCGQWDLSTKYIPGEGDNPEAFIIGEAPGADEDVQGRPFVGPAGQVLRQLMGLAGLFTEYTGKLTGYPVAEVFNPASNAAVAAPNCWLTNVIKFRPARNRNPTDEEIWAARPLLRAEWEAVGKPRLIIPVGGIALRAITGKKISILRTAGKCHWYAGKDTGKGQHTLAIWPMVHPAFVLRQNNETLQALIENDWYRLGEWRKKNEA